MKKLFIKILLLTLVVFAPASAMAGISVHLNLPLPPPIIFPAPPQLVVIPGTNVYAAPDVQDEIFFSAGWWWRSWQGHWYRSHYYDRGWAPYGGVPSFQKSIPPGWRDNYRAHQWEGQPWHQERIPHNDLQRNWRGWERDKHWERNSWGVQGLQQKRRPPRDTRNNPHQQQKHKGKLPQNEESHFEPGVGPVPGPAHSR